jgi:CAAX prenyl protease-like protein
LFQNSITGHVSTSIPPSTLTPVMIVLRTARAALLVPVLEELFWRGWLPRWIQSSRFDRIPLGQYTPLAFWATAVLFAAEHGPFWEVGLLTGIIYNWWMRRTRSLGDLMLVHAVTNLSLSLFVVATRQWAFWM